MHKDWPLLILLQSAARLKLYPTVRASERSDNAPFLMYVNNTSNYFSYTTRHAITVGGLLWLVGYGRRIAPGLVYSHCYWQRLCSG